MTFDLNAAIESAVMDSSSHGPHEIAEKVFPSIPASELPALAERLLASYVREYLHDRRAANPLLSGTRATAAPAMRQAPQPSAKLAQRRTYMRAWLRDQIHIGNSKWRPVGECGRDELLYAAQERMTHAERNAAKAALFTALAELLAAHNVATVAKLPPAVLDEIFGA